MRQHPNSTLFVGRFLKVLLAVTACQVLAPSVSVIAFEETQKKVLVIYAARKDSPSPGDVDRMIFRTLGDGLGGNLDLYSEYIDIGRFSEHQYQGALRDFLREKYQKTSFDVIIATSGTPIEFLQQFGSELFPGTPVVFITGDDLHPLPNATGISTTIDLKGTVELGLVLQPETKQVFVISGASEFDSFYRELAERQLAELQSRVSFTYLTGLTLAELKLKVANLPPDSIIYFLTYSSDRSGNNFVSTFALEQIAPLANVPIYCWHEAGMGLGIVGGNLMSSSLAAEKASEIALRVLRGEDPNRIPVERVRISFPQFDWRQLQRWNLDEDRLPEGNVVLFKQPTVWQQYKWRIVGIVSLCILEALLIGFLLIQRARRRQAEKEIERFAELVQAQHRRLDEVVSNVPGVVWETRLDPGSGSNNIEFLSRYVEKMFGYTANDLTSSQELVRDLVAPDDRERVEREVREILANKTSGVIQSRWRTKDGRSIWAEAHLAAIIDENGEAKGLRGVTMDITGSKKAEESLRESEQRLRLGLRAGRMIAWDWDLVVGKLNTVGDLSEICGIDSGSPEHKLFDLLHPEDLPRHETIINNALENHGAYRSEFRMVRPDNGATIWIEERGEAVPNVNRGSQKLTGVVIDISERRKAEEALRTAHEELGKLKDQLEAENVYLQEEIRRAHSVDEIIGQSDAIKYVLFKSEQVAKTDTTVLILGETGTGKELVAQAIHNQSLRKDRPLVKVNCAALTPSLIESDLFGHEKGAFTGASARKIGRFEIADGATIFLDEIGELPLDLQAKLLRVVQEGEFERLGSTKTLKVDVRILAATNRNLKSEVEKGTFREDLWYRLNVFPITVPPLRQRRDDIPMLVEHFVAICSKKIGKDISGVSGLNDLQAHSWPGNVRELANLVERAVINAKGPILQVATQLQPEYIELDPQTLEEMEKEYIGSALVEAGWRIEGAKGAARRLGLHPSTLRTKMTKLGIHRPMGEN